MMMVMTDCSLVADVALFNSQFNRDSFLDNMESFLHTMPDCRPSGVRDQLKAKCRVLYYPVEFNSTSQRDHQHNAVIQQPPASSCITTSSLQTVNSDTDRHADTVSSNTQRHADTVSSDTHRHPDLSLIHI